jgi:hypothetical protein
LEAPRKSGGITIQWDASASGLAYGDGVNLVGEQNPKSNTGKEVSLEVNAERTKYVLMTHHQNAGQICNMKMIINPFKNVAS